MPTASIERKRHYHLLSEQETDDVVEVVADLILNFLKRKRDSENSIVLDVGTAGHTPPQASI